MLCRNMNSKLILSAKLTAQKQTVLDDYFATPPFKVMTLPAYDDIWPQGLNAMQMSASPGLLGGDRLEIRISLAENTALSLNTQAFTRVQSMHAGDFAEQITHINLAANSRLFYLPHPLVLHKESAFKQKTTVHMEKNSELIYGEIIAVGRVLNGECFAFHLFSSHLKIFHQKRPLVSDCIYWLPKEMNLTALGQMEEFSHQGSLVYLNLARNETEIKALTAEVQALGAAWTEGLFGSSQLNRGGLTIRVLARRADAIQALFERIGKMFKKKFKN